MNSQDDQFAKLISGYSHFRKKYAQGEDSLMRTLEKGQKPKAIVVACCDSRVDPSIILQCDPGDLFIIRNVANIVPPFKKDGQPHFVGAALEFGIRFLNIKHLILLGHSQCGGIKTLLLDEPSRDQNDFLTDYVATVKKAKINAKDVDSCAQSAIHVSYENCFTFPWLREKVEKGELFLHQWFFDIKKGEILRYSGQEKAYNPLMVTPQKCRETNSN